MPRDAQGNFSLPNGSIVASGDTVLPSQHNPPLQDIAQGLTQSLSRNGNGGMLAPLQMSGYPITNLSPGSADTDAATVGQVRSQTPQAGFIQVYAGQLSALSASYLPCYGQTLLRAEWPELFAAIGTTYGSTAGDNFLLPDARGRVSAGFDDGSAERLTGPVDARIVGDTGGSQTHSLGLAEMPAHNHGGSTSSAGAHTHSVTAQSTGSGGTDIATPKWNARTQTNYGARSLNTNTAGAHTHGIPSQGSGNPHNNVQPTIIFHIVITTGR